MVKPADNSGARVSQFVSRKSLKRPIIKLFFLKAKKFCGTLCEGKSNYFLVFRDGEIYLTAWAIDM